MKLGIWGGWRSIYERIPPRDEQVLIVYKEDINEVVPPQVPQEPQ